MYYPYLRGLQFELIAIRDLAKMNHVHDFVRPIIEPVKKSLNSLILAKDALKDISWHPHLILNPQVGDFENDPSPLLEFYNEEEGFEAFNPAFIYTDNHGFIKEMINHYNMKNVMIICLDGFSSNQELLKLLDCNAINSVVLLDPTRNRSLDKRIKSLKKTYIRLDDLFVPESTNASYVEVGPQKFTEEHMYYIDDGYSGYSDYTLLPSSFQPGGFLPRAISIHWSYLINDNSENEGQIWVRHFTSESNYNITNIQGKFAEAAKKLCNSAENNELMDTEPLNEMKRYVEEQRYPGLGVVKKLSILNHILVNYEYLSNK